MNHFFDSFLCNILSKVVQFSSIHRYVVCACIIDYIISDVNKF